VRVSDGTFLFDKIFSITVTNVNESPVSTNDSYTIDRNTTLNVSVVSGILVNDSDVDSPNLTITGVLLPINGILTLS
jgi:hypothetical protein